MKTQKWEEACSDQISYVNSGKKACENQTGPCGLYNGLGYYSKCSKKARTGFWQENKLNNLALKKKKQTNFEY